MAITVPAYSFGATTTGLTVSAVSPSGIQVGDVLLAAVVSQETTQQAFSASGWIAPAQPGYGATNVAGARIETLLYRVVTDAAALAALPGTFTFTKGGSSNRNAVGIIVVRGADPDAPINVVGTWQSNSSSVGTTVPSVTTTKDGCLVLLLANGNASAGTNMLPISAPSGMSLIGYYQSPAGTADSDTSGSRTLVSIFGAIQTLAGASGTKTFIQNNATPGKAGYLVAISPKPVVTPPALVPTPGVTWFDGSTEVPARLSYWDGATETVATSVELNDGSYDLAALSSTERFYVAHRGGSLSYPEMTAEAYRRSGLILGVRALEMSVHRTTDGVFVLAHDDNLLRATGTSISIAASTWAQLSGLQVKASLTDNPTQGNQALARLVDVLPLWIGKRVIFIEDKTYNATNRTALLDYLATFGTGWQDHIVWKVDGTTTDPPITAAKTRGLKTWGYYFTGQDPALFPARAARFDYIGPDAASGGTGFTSAEWAAAEATGVPMIAHIIQTAAQLAIALAHPVVGVMLANTRELYPR